MARLRNWMAEARRLEAAGDLQSASAILRKALAAQEETAGFGDLGVLNALGDLCLRLGQGDEALDWYERAARQCEEQQLYANGIALCKKILRNAPERLEAHRRMARLSALSGLEAEARRHYERYQELATSRGRAGEALEALAEIVEITGVEELTFDLADALIAEGRPREALQALRKARDGREAAGRSVVLILRRIQQLQLEIEPERPPLESLPPESPPLADGSDPDDVSNSLEELHEELTRVLDELDGVRRLRTALDIVDRMLILEPGSFDLLHRKLELA
ncbi:MAG: tetratricopeptide repeat protein, partial [Gemmatimonadota bacterium]|nr:tetratricopeptide repeat protein [Gemmatimonadota bacterium]